MAEDKLTPPPAPFTSGKKQSGDNGGTIKTAFIAFVVSIIVLVVASLLMGGFATKKYTNATFVPITQLTQLQTEITNVETAFDTAIVGLPNTVATQVNSIIDSVTSRISQVETNIANLQAQTNLVQDNYNSIQSSIAQINTEITTIKAQIVEINKAITDYGARITSIETKLNPITTPSGGAIIPNVTLAVNTTDEGTILATDNSTIGQFKLALVNSGAENVQDITVSLFVYFDNCVSANQAIVSASYGTWSVRNRQTDMIELRCRLSTLNAGQTRRIYVDIKSFAIGFASGNQITYMSVYNNDIEVVDWNYEN